MEFKNSVKVALFFKLFPLAYARAPERTSTSEHGAMGKPRLSSLTFFNKTLFFHNNMEWKQEAIPYSA